jgi:hypothetical protein
LFSIDKNKREHIMRIILSPKKASPSRICSASEMDLDLVFNQKRKELLNQFTSGVSGFNYCMAQMYILGRQQERVAKIKRSIANVINA